MSSNISQSDSTDTSFYVPDALKFYINRLSFSKNRVRLQALSSQTASANGQIIVRLPSNTMLNMASLTMTGSVRASIADPQPEEGVALPTNLDYSFIESLSVISNGGIISQPFINYKLLANVLNDVYGGDEKISNRAGLQGSLPSQLFEYAAVVAQGANSAYVPFSINSWISPLQSMQPSYINTNLLGDIELRITLSDNSVLMSGNITDGAAIGNLQSKCNFDIKDINFYIETASIQNTILDQAIESKLRSGEPILIPFENVFSFQQTNGGASFNQRFSVSSQSINKIIAVTQLDVDARPDVNQKAWFNGVPQALRRNHNGATQCQFSINNQYSPNYMIDSGLNTAFDFGRAAGTPPVFGGANIRAYQQSSALVETVAALDIQDYDYGDAHHKLTSTTQMPFEFFGGGVFNTGAAAGAPVVPVVGQSQAVSPILRSAQTFWVPYVYKTGIETFLHEKYVVATSFDLACDHSRLMSGINTLGSNSQLFYNVVGGAGDPSRSTIFCLCTSTIQVFAGAQLKIIQ
jgi:hypothetical protein